MNVMPIDSLPESYSLQLCSQCFDPAQITQLYVYIWAKKHSNDESNPIAMNEKPTKRLHCNIGMGLVCYAMPVLLQ